MKTPYELAKKLAEYGVWGAGCDPTPEQKEWAADCIEAAIAIAKGANIGSVAVCGKEWSVDLLVKRAHCFRVWARLRSLERSDIVEEISSFLHGDESPESCANAHSIAESIADEVIDEVARSADSDYWDAEDLHSAALKVIAEMVANN